ncbi:PHA/PHB synthase family protein [Pseudooceanicola spongiae]|uniref:PHA/PHB synthase family protein n=1 Tax=Pseudooceanicola spongiae TaxID=2613965 RepID=UPI001D030428|nr:alpha/beta fold hydrolase [Pseudooceanicola spongiae]
MDPLKTVKTAALPVPEQPSVYAEIDRVVHAGVARATSGLAPSMFGEAWMDWAVHMAVSPGKQLQLMEKSLRDTQALAAQAFRGAAGDAAPDARFAGEGWQAYPFNIWAQSHQQAWRWWQEVVTGVHGVTPAHEKLMAFTTGLVVDAAAPSNFPATNPEVIAATLAEKGQNLVRGVQNLGEDIGRKSGAQASQTPPHFAVGQTLAMTPGKVVFRNELIELIQYTPQSDTVRPEPILIVPAWIMKYYILDLSQTNSLVKYLVEQGYSVFILSWKNPGAEDRGLGMEDYRQLGVVEAVDAVQAITKAEKIHAVGYCLGGTLLSIAAAAMARDGDDRLASVSLLAAQIDFTDAGELRLFISESEVTLIEDMMAQTGFLTSDQMSGAFALLRARDLIWAPMIRDYMLGQRGDDFDLMAWNGDATRMPARMHSEYLRWLYLNNDLTEGRYHVGNKAVAVSDIRAPMFVVGTEHDHVAPWRSVYKIHLFVDTEVTFVLTSGGHNAGIVSEPGHAGRHFRIAKTPLDAPFRDPDEWLAATEPQEGSWWLAFVDWLNARSSTPGDLPPMGGTKSGKYAALCDAPGTYVRQA